MSLFIAMRVEGKKTNKSSRQPDVGRIPSLYRRLKTEGLGFRNLIKTMKIYLTTMKSKLRESVSVDAGIVCVF